MSARVGAVLSATLAVATMLVGTAPRAVAQAASPTTSPTPGLSKSRSSSPALPVGLSLVSQDTWVGLGHTFTMNLHIDNPTLANRPGAQISIRIDQSRTSRSSFQEVIDNGDPGDTIFQNLITVAALRPDARGVVPITFGLSNSGVSPTIRIRQPGVYPVAVQLVNTGVASESFVTWLVVVDASTPNPIDKKLAVAFVAQAVANPITLPDGTDDPKVVAEMTHNGRLDKIAALLAANPGVRTSLVVSPETAVAWKRLARADPAIAHSFTSIRAAVTRPSTEVLPTPYVPIDAASLDAAGLGSYLKGEYAQGAASMRAAFGANPAASAQSAFIEPVPTSDAVIDGLRSMLIDRVAVREPALVPVNHPFSPARAFVLDTATGSQSRGVATAPYLEDLLKSKDPGALRAERVIAALAEVAYEAPAIARGVVIAPTERWNPDPRTMQTIFSALHTMPLVQSATLDDLFATVTNEQALGTTVQRRLAAGTPAPAPVDPAKYLTTTSELAAYSSVVGAKDPVVVKGKAALLTTLSTSMSPERVRSELDQIDVAVRAFTAGVRADEKRITLTSRRAEVPLTFENDLKPPRSVRVRVHLDSAKLVFPKGSDLQVPLKPGSNTISFDVEARASGTFPMTITVTSPDGLLQFGAPVQVTVRSAVFGGWAIGLTIAALVFLAGWWANHFRRTRKKRRAERQSPPPAPTPAT